MYPYSLMSENRYQKPTDPFVAQREKLVIHEMRGQKTLENNGQKFLGPFLVDSW